MNKLPKIKLTLDANADGNQWIWGNYIVTRQSHPAISAFSVFYKGDFIEACDTKQECRDYILYHFAKQKRLKISDLKIGDKFMLIPNGIVWIVETIQGMYDKYSYCRTELKFNTRCNRESYRYKLFRRDTLIFNKL